MFKENEQFDDLNDVRDVFGAEEGAECASNLRDSSDDFNVLTVELLEGEALRQVFLDNFDVRQVNIERFLVVDAFCFLV